MPDERFRRTGRTTQMLQDVLEDVRGYEGRVLLVMADQRQAQSAIQMLRGMGAEEDEVRRVLAVSADSSLNKVRGHRFASMHVDHFVYESVNMFRDMEKDLVAHLTPGRVAAVPDAPRITVWELLMQDDDSV